MFLYGFINAVSVHLWLIAAATILLVRFIVEIAFIALGLSKAAF